MSDGRPRNANGRLPFDKEKEAVMGTNHAHHRPLENGSMSDHGPPRPVMKRRTKSNPRRTSRGFFSALIHHNLDKVFHGW